MLEDLHHFDSISWSFLTTVAEKMSDQVLVVTTIRPNDGVLSVASRHEEGETQRQLVQTQAVPVVYPSTINPTSCGATASCCAFTVKKPLLVHPVASGLRMLLFCFKCTGQSMSSATCPSLSELCFALLSSYYICCVADCSTVYSPQNGL